MYNQLMQDSGEASVFSALINGAWIHPQLALCYVEEGDTLLITTLDNRWLRFKATHPTEEVELRWETTLPSTVEKRELYQVSVAEHNIYLQLHRILHARAYLAGTDTELTDVTWVWTASSVDYQKFLYNRVFLEGQSWSVTNLTLC